MVNPTLLRTAWVRKGVPGPVFVAVFARLRDRAGKVGGDTGCCCGCPIGTRRYMLPAERSDCSFQKVKNLCYVSAPQFVSDFLFSLCTKTTDDPVHVVTFARCIFLFTAIIRQPQNHVPIQATCGRQASVVAGKCPFPSGNDPPSGNSPWLACHAA